MSHPSILDKCLGSIIGGAVGDALGYAVEFSAYSSILARYGAPGITDYELDDDGLARFSDDTQMTLFTAEGLLRGVKAEGGYVPDRIVPYITAAYLDWLATQEKPFFKLDSEIAAYPELWHRRAPGNTCMSALRSIASGNKVRNNSKGCGSVMRIAPIALYAGAHRADVSLVAAARLAGMSGDITHRNMASTMACQAMAMIIGEMTRTESPVDAEYFANIVNATASFIVDANPGICDARDVAALLTSSVAMAFNSESDYKNIRHIGEGWVADEALAIAVYCVARHIDDFKACIVAAVNHDGDSDSTGAIAGNIIGAILGVEAIPREYTDKIELLPLLSETAASLAIPKR